MFQGIEDWFHKLMGTMSKEEKVFLHYMLPIAQSVSGDIMAQALPFATTIVESLVAGPGGTAARDQATSQLKDTLVKQGIAGAEKVGASALNFVVETALQNLKATTVPPTASS